MEIFTSMFLPPFVLFVILSPSAAMAGELILDGYRLTQASRDSSMYTGVDGVPDLHSGNHLHDPCTAYVGERFNLTGSVGGEGRGFVVVNDCQVVECTKWTTEGGGHGGVTDVYDIVEDSDSSMSWDVMEDGSCRYVGKFFHKADDCSVEGTPGSISCTADPVGDQEPSEEPREEPKMTVSSIVLDTTEKAGISVGAIIGAALLALLVLYCCCCRKKKQDKDVASDSGSTVDEEQALASVAPRSSKQEHVAASSGTANSATGGWLKFGGKKNSARNAKTTSPVQASAKVHPSSKDNSKHDAKLDVKNNQVSPKVKPVSTKIVKQKTSSAIKNSLVQEKHHPSAAKKADRPDTATKSWTFSNKDKTSDSNVPETKKKWFGKKSAEVEEPTMPSPLPRILVEPAFDEKKGFHSLFPRKKMDQSGTELILESDQLNTKPEEGHQGNPTPESGLGTEKANSALQKKELKQKQQKDEVKAADTEKEATPPKKETVASPDNTQPVDCTCCGLRS